MTGVVPAKRAEAPRNSGIASTYHLRAGTAIRYQLGVPGRRIRPTTPKVVAVRDLQPEDLVAVARPPSLRGTRRHHSSPSEAERISEAIAQRVLAPPATLRMTWRRSG